MIEQEIVRSFVTNGVASSTASFFSNQLNDVDLKQERLNELLLEINSAIEFAKGHESLLNSSLCEWLDDLKKASKEGTEVQIAFRDDQSEEDTIRSIINPWKVAVRLYKRSMRVNRLNAVVIRLERKASNCEKFRQMLRDEIDKQRDEIYTERVEKLERKMARLRKKLKKTIRSNGLIMKRKKKTKLAHGLIRRGHDYNAIPISEPKLGDHNHDEPEEKEDLSLEQEIQQQRPHKRPTVSKFGEWGDINSSPSTVSFDEIFNGIRTRKTAVKVRGAAYRGNTSFLSRPTKTHAVPKFGEWDNIINSSPARGDYIYNVHTMRFEYAKMKKDAGTTTPIHIIPAERERTPERNAHRSDFISLLSKLFACVSLNTSD